MIEMTKPSKISDIFRERVREEIRSHGLTMSYVAEKAGISLVHLSRVLAGKADVSLPVAEQISESLGIPLADLITEKIHI
jgi:transcriptional regulator with XRE-family HTH domain